MDETVKELLKNVRVAAPCAERWDAMPGSDNIRSCERCRHKVYNLSEMTAPEAADLLRNVEGRLCVRFYRRADGTMMTKDCPVGVRAVRQRVARTASVACASIMTLSVFNLASKPRSEYPVLLRLLLDRVAPEHTMGDTSSVEAPPVASPSPIPLLPLPAFRPTPKPIPVLGMVSSLPAPAADAPVDDSPSPTSEKKFLRDLPVQNDSPRDDPFAKMPRETQAVR